jgi:hypothetical protein
LPVAADAHAQARERALASPAAASALQEEKVTQSAIDLARRERWPVPSVSMGHMRTAEPYGAANVLGLSVEIPLLDTRRGPVARATAEATAATMRRELVVAETTATLERYANVIAARETALQRFEGDGGKRLPAGPRFDIRVTGFDALALRIAANAHRSAGGAGRSAGAVSCYQRPVGTCRHRTKVAGGMLRPKNSGISLQPAAVASRQRS